jgi:tetratricopeptide (TPR) repeat protein
VQEGRFQQALELGKQLYKLDPALPHKELLRRIYLGRVRQLRSQGSVRDAQALLDHALQAGDGDPAWLEQLAEELAACGEVRKALELLGRVPGSQATPRVLAQAADSALAQGSAGRKLLPEALQGPFDAILQAFAQLEAGQDEQARETLQTIGLQSAFLEWKLLLRGLQAYYQNDDARAIENWQRLRPDRLPARLAAPLRFRIDPPYRTSLPPETQAILQRQGDRLQDPGLVQPLRVIQASLANEEELPRALRLAENLLPTLRHQSPHLTSRLAASFYWMIVHSGQPEDVSHYQRVFGAPADDPRLFRLKALLHEQLGELDKAHRQWQSFEREVAENPSAWPGEQANRVRALVWCRMGHNAASVPDPDQIPNLPPFLRDHPSRPRPLTPDAEHCYQRSLELAPDQLDPYEALFHYYQHQEDEDGAEGSARQLLERFPEHVPTLVALADLKMSQAEYADALSLFQRALQANPLDRRLRSKVGDAHLFNARAHAEEGRFDEARAEYQAALAYSEGKNNSSALCKWAACEFKAGNPVRAEELLQQALTEADTRLAVAFSMVIETIRLKLPRALKSRFDKEFNDGLAERPTAAGAVAIADTAAAHRLADVQYYGQKTHEKKVLTYLDKAHRAEFTEEQLKQLCYSLLALEADKTLEKFAVLGQKKFPQNPHFYYLAAEANIARGPYRCPVWKVQSLLMKAEELARQLPDEPQRKSLLAGIEQRRQMIGIHNMISNPAAFGMFEDMLDQLYDDEDDDEFEDDEDWP